MGEAVSSKRYTPEERTLYREKLAENLELFDTYLRHADFKSAGTIGLELELNLVGEGISRACNQEVLARLDDEYQSEIGAFNLELNHPVLQVAGRGLKTLEAGVAHRLEKAQKAAAEDGLKVVSIGTLPTLTTQILTDEKWMTEENRYEALSNSVIDARGEYVRIELGREERYRAEFSDIAPESSCTSMQLHLQVAPNRFADAWNASQAIAGAQVAMAANSPLFVGRKLWHESRIPIFAQSIDTRTPELVNQGVRPRVGSANAGSPASSTSSEENVRYFPPLLPEIKDFVEFRAADAPKLFELNLHNGTVWRWNRPIYNSGDGGAHIRVENRLLPAGPTPVDMVADAAFYYGLAEFLVGRTVPVWSRMSFAEAEENFNACARTDRGPGDLEDRTHRRGRPRHRCARTSGQTRTLPAEYRQGRHRRIYVDHRRPGGDPRQRRDLAAPGSRVWHLTASRTHLNVPRGLRPDGRLPGEPGDRKARPHLGDPHPLMAVRRQM